MSKTKMAAVMFTGGILLLLLGCSQSSLPASANTDRESNFKEKEMLQFKKTTEVSEEDSQTSAGKKAVKKTVLDVPLVNQMASPQIYNGCEVSSLAMLLKYHGYEVTKSELADKIPRVPLTYENGLKGNPNKGFVGDMEDGPGLTVYHGPIHNLAADYAGKQAVDLTGKSAETLFQHVSNGMPVWVITTTNSVPVNNFKTWNTPSGKIQVTFSVHSVVVTGVDEKYVYINNPYGYKNQRLSKENFIAAWKQMGSQAVTITN
ncbi:C39 family peptidase [Virgibacillus siamensis]|uniref:C39 family peptidase n=1 Tax=Virgibacillus siamensis TaxID=480071 RepID=A0ABP3QWV6_9BACI